MEQQPTFFVSPDDKVLFERNCFGLTLGHVREIVAKETGIAQPELVVSFSGSLYHLSPRQDNVRMDLLGIAENSLVKVYSSHSFSSLKTSIKPISSGVKQAM